MKVLIYTLLFYMEQTWDAIYVNRIIRRIVLWMLVGVTAGVIGQSWTFGAILALWTVGCIGIAFIAVYGLNWLLLLLIWNMHNLKIAYYRANLRYGG